jgi:hypothetical protein
MFQIVATHKVENNLKIKILFYVKLQLMKKMENFKIFLLNWSKFPGLKVALLLKLLRYYISLFHPLVVFYWTSGMGIRLVREIPIINTLPNTQSTPKIYPYHTQYTFKKLGANVWSILNFSLSNSTHIFELGVGDQNII